MNNRTRGPHFPDSKVFFCAEKSHYRLSESMSKRVEAWRRMASYKLQPKPRTQAQIAAVCSTVCARCRRRNVHRDRPTELSRRSLGRYTCVARAATAALRCFYFLYTFTYLLNFFIEKIPLFAVKKFKARFTDRAALNFYADMFEL